MNLWKIPCKLGGETIRCVVETPRGSKAQFVYDPEVELFTLSRSLPLGIGYPFDRGFIPSTVGEDGEPLDVMILHDTVTAAGVAVRCRLVGVLEMRVGSGKGHARDDRFFAVPIASRNGSEVKDATELPERLRKELEQFFTESHALERKKLTFDAWNGSQRAAELLDEGRRKFDWSQSMSRSSTGA
jgi:inorganic pyrophosphatase